MLYLLLNYEQRMPTKFSLKNETIQPTVCYKQIFPLMESMIKRYPIEKLTTSTGEPIQTAKKPAPKPDKR